MGNDSIGLVLSGGGAKGAFQAGVWKAMCELGLADRVSVISGTSAGAINAAAFAALRDPEKICRFWRTKVGDIATPIPVPRASRPQRSGNDSFATAS